MSVFKVSVKSNFFVEADSFHEARAVVDRAVSKLPNFEVGIKITKKLTTGLNFETLPNPKDE